MDQARTIEEVREKIAAARRAGKRIGFVPTMGYLHDGHASLVRESRKHSDFQVMSIFVNRMQFNDPKDFDNYPVDLDQDMRVAESAGVDLLFFPDEKEMYAERKTYVDMETLTDNLCGAYRPGHFRGVFTVVSKFFNIVQPDVAVFGQKDIQQAVSIEKMVEDLNFPIRIIIAPIIRDEAGLAMSSRNKHLSADERKRALVLSQSLRRAGDLLKKGERRWEVIRKEMESIVRSGSPTVIDYISLVRYDNLQSVEYVSGRSVIAVAAFFGTTRLIDNMIVRIEGDNIECTH
jgi:pantoate--beta-alanine ligase